MSLEEKLLQEIASSLSSVAPIFSHGQRVPLEIAFVNYNPPIIKCLEPSGQDFSPDEQILKSNVEDSSKTLVALLRKTGHTVSLGTYSSSQQNVSVSNVLYDSKEGSFKIVSHLDYKEVRDERAFRVGAYPSSIKGVLSTYFLRLAVYRSSKHIGDLFRIESAFQILSFSHNHNSHIASKQLFHPDFHHIISNLVREMYSRTANSVYLRDSQENFYRRVLKALIPGAVKIDLPGLRKSPEKELFKIRLSPELFYLITNQYPEKEQSKGDSVVLFYI